MTSAVIAGVVVRAVVAAKDSAATVAATVGALRSLASVSEVLVVDDGSVDATAEAARRAGAWVLVLPVNGGKGAAVAAGAAAMPETDVYLLVDADVGVTAAAAEALLEPVLSGRADMAVGVLPSAAGRGGFGAVRRFAAAGIKRACGKSVQAPLSGQRAVRGTLLRSLDLAPRFGLETALTIDAVRAGAVVVEVAVAMDHRHTGRTAAGFAHRGRQGIDVARAVWPRATMLRTRIAVTLALAVAAVAASLWSAGRWESPSSALSAPARRVLIVGIPGLAWTDVASGSMPSLDRLIDSGGALGAMTVRTGSAHPNITEAYASLGAGSRVVALPSVGVAEGGGDQPVVVKAAPALRAGSGRYLPSSPGALGDALRSAGKRTAVVGNADLAFGLSDPGGRGQRPALLRPAAVAVMDGSGVVDAGAVNHEQVLIGDPLSPFGLRADSERVLRAARDGLARADVVMVDPGDMTRVAALAELGPLPSFVARARARALANTDELLGRLTSDLPSDTLVLVVSVTPPGDGWRLTPVVISGSGVTGGYLQSPSTRRLGLVTLTDVAPTVLDALGVPVPTALVGHPLRYVATAPVTPGPTRLARLDAADVYRGRVYLPVVIGFVAAQALIYLTAAAVLRRRGPGADRGRRALRAAALGIAAFPLATFGLRGLGVPYSWGVPGAVVALVGIDVAMVAVACRFRRHRLSPLAAILGLTVAALVIDVATGARLQEASLMGYSPQVAGRFYGLGNTTFAILAAATLLGGALHLDHAPRRVEALVGVGALFAVVVIADGAPSMGDDVGGILTLVPVFGLTMLALAHRRLSWRTVAVAAAATLVVLGSATALDLSRPPQARTHLGRQAATIRANGLSTLVDTVSRKATVNLRILGGSTWTWMVPVITVFMFELLVRQKRAAELLPPGSSRRVAVIAVLATGILGAAVNDSGVVVTALVLVYLGSFLALLALDRADDRPTVLLEP